LEFPSCLNRPFPFRRPGALVPRTRWWVLYKFLGRQISVQSTIPSAQSPDIWPKYQPTSSIVNRFLLGHFFQGQDHVALHCAAFADGVHFLVGARLHVHLCWDGGKKGRKVLKLRRVQHDFTVKLGDDEVHRLTWLSSVRKRRAKFSLMRPFTALPLCSTFTW